MTALSCEGRRCNSACLVVGEEDLRLAASVAKGRQVVIYPEGHRGEPGVAGDYKPGIAALYRELDVPVYPVATNSGVHWPPHGFLRRPGVIVYEFLEPIPPGLRRAAFMRELETRIETASQRLLTE